MAHDGLCRDLGLPLVKVQVLDARPRDDYGELHGLYTYDPPHKPLIQLWMRTAAHRRVVAFRSFLRTLLHEFGHHLDYHLFQFGDSFHTQGFYARESSLFRQVAPDEKPDVSRRPRDDDPPPSAPKSPRRKSTPIKSAQLDFPFSK